jgi:hypothetical protein
MKNHSSRFLFAALVFIVMTCATSAFGQKRPPNVGGYSSAKVDDADVKIAAQFAVKAKAAELKQKIVLQSIAKAERQVVAGTNYRLCIEAYATPLKDGEDGVTVWAKVIVYREPAGAMKLTSWEESDCNEE